MSISVQIISFSGTSYDLLVERIEHSMVRMPTQSAMPGDPDTQEPMDLFFDLGMCLQQITLTGLVNSTGTPSKTNLENAVKTWWKTSSTKTDMNRLVIAGVTYYGGFRNASFTQLGALQDRWEYTLTFLVTEGLE